MIVPNLMVSDVARSIAFYRDTLGFEVAMSVAADKSFSAGADIVENPVFAVVTWDTAEIMLQSVESLASELSVFTADQVPQPGGTIYLRGYDPDTLALALDSSIIMKPLETSWYGMKELYIRDPDGHILCLGAPDGAPPESGA